MLSGKFWKTPALYDLPEVLLSEKQITKLQPSQQHLLNKANKELQSYAQIIKDLQEELADASLPYDTAEAIAQKLQHFKRMAAIAHHHIQSYKAHREKAIEIMSSTASGFMNAIPKSYVEMLSDEERVLLARSCERQSEMLVDTPSLDPKASVKVRVLILEKRIMPDLNHEANEKNSPLRLYQSGLVTFIRKDKAQIAEKEGFLMILKGEVVR